MIIDRFFDVINTKTTAYWLGFLFADGCVQPQLGRLKIEISSKDDWLLHKFKYDLSLTNKIEIRDKYSMLRLNRNDIIKNLILHGCVSRKSKIIELPVLDSYELYLAFLLGFFDGDGKQGTTIITCGSVKFLEQIKEMFQLPFKIYKKSSDHEYRGRKISGMAYDTCLGSKLFNEMMRNYADSLPRKRKCFCTKEEKSRRAAESSRSNTGKQKFIITKEKLERLIWEMPSTRISEVYGISDSLVTRRCHQLNIEKPPRGYWTLKNNARGGI